MLCVVTLYSALGVVSLCWAGYIKAEILTQIRFDTATFYRELLGEKCEDDDVLGNPHFGRDL